MPRENSFVAKNGTLIDLYEWLEIPSLLASEGLKADAEAFISQVAEIDESRIKRQFRRLALKYHPDKNPGFEERFKDISYAYDVLSQRDTRDLYNKLYHAHKIKEVACKIRNREFLEYKELQTKRQKILREELEKREQDAVLRRSRSAQSHLDQDAEDIGRQINEYRKRNRDYLASLQKEILNELPTDRPAASSPGLDKQLYLLRLFADHSSFDYTEIYKILEALRISIIANTASVHLTAFVDPVSEVSIHLDSMDPECTILQFTDEKSALAVRDRLIERFSSELTIKLATEKGIFQPRGPLTPKNPAQTLLCSIHDTHMVTHQQILNNPYYKDLKKYEDYIFEEFLQRSIHLQR